MSQALLSKLVQGKPALEDGRYLPWNELRRRPPPKNFTAEEWWWAVRFIRKSQSVKVSAMQGCYPVAFSFVELSGVKRALHRLDRTNVEHEIFEALGNESAKSKYRMRQLLEEAISSSQVEGARPTTREVARQMVREDRAPASPDEYMILNNWKAMQRMLAIHQEGRALGRDDLLELHSIIGENSLEVEGAAGMFRTQEHDVTVSDIEGNIWHTPPDANGLEKRIDALLEFANAKEDHTQKGGEFIHPIIRAILSHFWLAYEHPFRDGNGRMARALFYWSMLRQGYESASFLSISGPIDRKPTDYYLAFAHTEADEGDLTYFILHQLGVIQESLDELHEHLSARANRIKLLSKRIAKFDQLNHRQRSLLLHAVRHPLQGQTVEGQAATHQVHYMTARKDLADLEKLGLLEARKIGRTKRFYPLEGLGEGIEKASS